MTDVSLRLLVLKTHDVAALVSFYDCLGLQFQEEQHGNGPVHHSAALDDGIMEIYPLPTEQAVDATTRLGFAISNPDAVVEAIESVGGRVIQAVRETPWGYMALVADPDNRRVELYRS